MRRVLRRARDGATLNVDEAATLLQARGTDLTDLCSSAAKVRDAGLLAAGRPNTVTYSRKVFIPLTRLCQDKCHYCTFVTVPGKLRAAGHGHVPGNRTRFWTLPGQVPNWAARKRCSRWGIAPRLAGRKPSNGWTNAATTPPSDYVRAMSIRVLEETGLLPHLNPGVMSWQELSRLKPVAPSMGMMLETTATRLFTDKGECHYGSPDKDPAVRLRTLTDAGRLNIPFTTGILVGIGENFLERAESIMAIRKSQKAFGHIQEVIIQNFLAKPDTAMRNTPDAGLDEFLAAIAVARLLLGPTMRIQSPPNLVSNSECLALLGAGVDDWGGVSPLTPDHVNPERPWPNLETLAEISAEGGFTLTERTAAQPAYVLAGAPWIDPRIAGHVQALADPKTGLALPDTKPVGRPWQEPDESWESSGTRRSQYRDRHGRAQHRDPQ